MNRPVSFFGGAVQLYHGDCYDMDLAGLGAAAMVIDPPYEFNASGGGKYRAARPGLDDLIAAKLTDGFDLSVLSWKYAKAIVCFAHNNQVEKIMTRLRQGFYRVVLCAWHKTNPQPVANKHYLPDTEFFIHAWQKGHHPTGSLKDKHRFIVTPAVRSKLRHANGTKHPSVKPDAVMDKIIANVNYPQRGPILDAFMGTGSTGIAAVKAGHKFIGIETNKVFFEMACQRFSDFQTQTAEI